MIKGVEISFHRTALDWAHGVQSNSGLVIQIISVSERSDGLVPVDGVQCIQSIPKTFMSAFAFCITAPSLYQHCWIGPPRRQETLLLALKKCFRYINENQPCIQKVVRNGQPEMKHHTSVSLFYMSLHIFAIYAVEEIQGAEKDLTHLINQKQKP